MLWVGLALIWTITQLLPPSATAASPLPAMGCSAVLELIYMECMEQTTSVCSPLTVTSLSLVQMIRQWAAHGVGQWFGSAVAALNPPAAAISVSAVLPDRIIQG